MPTVTVSREDLLKSLEGVEPGLSKKAIVEQSDCFTADTMIHTLGGDFTAASLLKVGRTKFKVFSTDGESLKIGDAFGLRLVKKGAKVYRITFDSGESLKLTCEHLVMLRDGTYRPVSQLQAGDSVMPFNYSYSHGGKYRVVCAGISTGRLRAAQWAFAETHGRPITPGCHVHHVDFNSLNDAPENLAEVPHAEHTRLHTVANQSSRRPEVALKISLAMRGNKNGAGKKPGTAHAMLGNKHAVGDKNHKVISVEYAGRQDVYDLSVHKYHNFAANGVFVHNCFVLGGGRVTCFNDEVFTEGPCPLNGDVVGAVPSQKFLEILRKLTQEELEVEAGDGRIIFKGKGRERFTVRVESEIALPVGEVEKPGKFQPLHPDFCEAVAAVGQCASRDQSQFQLTCVNLHLKWVEAMDDMQLARWRLDTGLTKPVLVRQSSVRHLQQLGMSEFSEGEGWLHFRTKKNSLRLSCRHYADEFPDLDQILSKLKGVGTTAQLPPGLAEAADKAAVFSSENPDANLVRVVLRSGRVRIKGEGLSGEYMRPLKCRYDGPNAEFLMPPLILQEICKKHTEVTIGEGKVWAKAGRLLYLACTVVPEVNVEHATAEEGAG